MSDAQSPAGFPVPDTAGHTPGRPEQEPGRDPEQAPGPGDAPVPDADAADDPAAPAPLDVGRAPTDNADVGAALRRLADADHLTTDGHVEVYEDVHRGLRDALTALDARPGPQPPGGHPAPGPR